MRGYWIGIGRGALAVAMAGIASVAVADTYTITVENLVPGGIETGQPMTPLLGVVHSAGYSLWAPGAMATPRRSQAT